MLEAFEQLEASPAFQHEMRFSELRHIVLPFESVELLRDIAARWADRRELEIARRVDAGQSRAEAEAAVPKITFDAIDVSFDAIEDPAERRGFMEMPTTFFCHRNPSTGCANWEPGSCVTRAPTRFCSSESRSSRSATLRRP
jgi:hypothetical protein